MAATLTERYISAVTKSLAPDAQQDVRTELEASIGDAVEARIDQGEEPTNAERAVLTDLGDPAALAAGYADRPLHLIGPKYFLTWWRLLKLLLWIVPFAAMAATALGQTISDAAVGTIIAQTVLVGIAAALHVCFWVTLVFAILERAGTDSGTKWDIDELPDAPQSGTGRSDMVASLVFVGLAAAAVLWDALRGFVRPDGEALPILNPGLWPWWMLGLLVILVLEAALAVRVHVVGRWSTSTATVNTVLAVLFSAAAVYLLVRGELVNPEFLAFIEDRGGDGFAAGNAEAAEQGGIFRIVAVLTGACIVGIGIWDIIDGWLKTRRAQRAK